jgi:hypothetical protein
MMNEGSRDEGKKENVEMEGQVVKKDGDEGLDGR